MSETKLMAEEEDKELIDNFRMVKEVEEGLAGSSLDQYQHDLNLFKSFINKTLLEANTRDIRAFLVHLKRDKGYKKTTLARKISTLRTFYDFLVKEKQLNLSPLSEIKTPKLDRTLPIFPTEEEIHTLIKTVKIENSSYKIRNLTILAVFIYTGARVKGVHNLNIKDINFEKETLRLVSKGGKHRYVKIAPVALELIKDYLKTRPKIDDDALFVSRNGNRLAIRTIQHIVAKYRDTAGLNPAISCHKLRHFFATTALSHGMDVRVIQQQLGHSNLSTTQKYTHVVDELLSSEYKKAFGNADYGIK
ncbi:MAG: site-specific tyrosine recombinase/integron integrase [Candidatus Sifarchaeia archaeon]|jgi:site-specific recombinase XerD